MRDKTWEKDKAMEKRTTEGNWAREVDEEVQARSSRVEKILTSMGMHEETLRELRNERAPEKRRAIIRTLLMRR